MVAKGINPKTGKYKTPKEIYEEYKATPSNIGLTTQEINIKESTLAQPPSLTKKELIEKQAAEKLQEENIKTQLIQEELAKQPIEPVIQPEVMQPQDKRGFFEKTFMPTAQEGAERRLKVFGTTRKEPAIAAGIIGGLIAGEALALGGVALLGTGVSAAATATAATTATAHSFKLLSLRNIAALGGAAFAIKTYMITQQNILMSSLSEYEQTIKEVKEGDLSYAAAQINVGEIMRNIQSAENSVKLVGLLDVLKWLGLKDTTIKFEIARRTIIPNLQLELIQAAQEARIKEAKSKIGL